MEDNRDYGEATRNNEKYEMLRSEQEIEHSFAIVTLMEEIEKYSKKYEFSFQFWPHQNNVWINKDGIEIFHRGGHRDMREVMELALQYIYKINRVPKKDRVC